jgi:hypothetical protein
MKNFKEDSLPTFSLVDFILLNILLFQNEYYLIRMIFLFL